MKNSDPILRERWNWILKNRFPYFWLPRFVDIALDYQENLPLEMYLQSDAFLSAVKDSLRFDEEHQKHRGIQIDNLTLNTIFDDSIPWMTGFTEMMLCRIKSTYPQLWRYNQKRESWQNSEDSKEIRSLCLDQIYNLIHNFNPTLSPFEKYLHLFVPWRVNTEFSKERKRDRWNLSLDAFLDDEEDISLNNILAEKPTTYEIQEIDIESLEEDDVFAALGLILQEVDHWDIFFGLTYDNQSCSQIAEKRGVSKNAISQQIGLIRDKITKLCLPAHPLPKTKKLQIRTFVRDFAAAVSRDQFLARVPRPSFSQDMGNGLLCFSE